MGSRNVRSRRARAATTAVLAIAASVTLAACGGDSGSEGETTGGQSTSASSGKQWRVAFLAASSQNGYNKAAFEGIEKKAKELGNVKATILDGKFDGQVQFNQMQDAAASGQYDGIVIMPNDTVSIAGAVGAAKAANIPVVTALFPIGPNLTQLEPQVPGVVATVASPPASGATKQAELAAEYCKDKNPCRVMILIGQVRFPFDKVRYDAYRAVLKQHPNIKVVATLEGNYDRDQSMKAMQDALQANPKFDVLLSNADQQTAGAQIALQNAKVDLKSVYLTGAGGTKEAIKAVRDGLWKANYVNFPVTQGEQALEQLVNALEKKPVKTVVDSDKEAPFDPFVDKQALDEVPEFTGQWSG
jgi:ribose transport system substrate-binding protein